ncbi:MAG: DUF4337 domain-containing protein [Nitrospirae bacterium]|nr:DUF4337 domain-containing protein [Nitrospirota bacterium]
MPEIEVPKHDELLELKERSFTRRVAVATAVFSVAMAICSLGGNNATKELLLAQQQSSDLWAFYQSKVIREHEYRIQKLRAEADLVDRGAKMSPEAREKLEAVLQKFTDEEKRYNAEKGDIEKEAKHKEELRDLNRRKDPYFDYAEVLLQIAVVMSSVAILSSSRPIFFFALTLAILGTFLMMNGYTLLVEIPLLGE